MIDCVKMLSELSEATGCIWNFHLDVYTCEHEMAVSGIMLEAAKVETLRLVAKNHAAQPWREDIGGCEANPAEAVAFHATALVGGLGSDVVMQLGKLAEITGCSWEYSEGAYFCKHGTAVSSIMLSEAHGEMYLALAKEGHAKLLLEPKSSIYKGGSSKTVIIDDIGDAGSAGILKHLECGGEVDQSERYGAHCQECGPVPAGEVQTAESMGTSLIPKLFEEAAMKSGFSTVELHVAASKKVGAPIFKQMNEAAIAAKMAADAEGVFDGMTKTVGGA